LFAKLRTGPPRPLVKLTIVATILNTVQQYSCNDLPPMLRMAQTWMPMSRRTCLQLNDWPLDLTEFLFSH